MASWLWLSLLSAFSLASADAATKRYLSDYTASELVVVRFACTGLLLLPILAWQPFPQLPIAFWGWVSVLAPLEVLAMFLYMSAIRTGPLTQTLPYLAFTPVFSSLTGFLLLDEQVSPNGFMGILMVTAGAYALNAEKAFADGKLAFLTPLKAIVHEKGPRLMLSVAILYSLTSVLGKGAMQYTTPMFFGPFYFVLLGCVTWVIFSLRDPRATGSVRRRPLAVLVVGSMMAVMVVTHYLAIQQVEVAYMISVKRTSLLFGILYGALVFKEERPFQHFIAGVVMVCGIFLITS